MGSLYLYRLSASERDELCRKLSATQNGTCFICEDELDLDLHSYQIDHVVPTKVGGKDDASNLALTHASCNESKQDSDLRVARILARFARVREECQKENRGPNLGDVLHRHGGSVCELRCQVSEEANEVRFSFTDVGDNAIVRAPLPGRAVRLLVLLRGIPH